MKCGIYSVNGDYSLSIKCNCGNETFVSAEVGNNNHEENKAIIDNLGEKLYTNNYMCECGNYNFFEYTKEDALKRKTINVPYVNVIQNDYKKLIVERINLSVKYTKNQEIKLKKNTSYTMILDFEKEGTMKAFKVLKNNEETEDMMNVQTSVWYSEYSLTQVYKKNFNGFMRNLLPKTLINIISLLNEKRSQYIEYLLSRNSRGDIDSNVFKNIIRICNYGYSYIEKLINAGYGNLNIVTRLVKNHKGNSPKEILGLGRLALEVLKEDKLVVNSYYYYREIDRFESEFGYNLAKEVYNIFIDEKASNNSSYLDGGIFTKLYNDFGFKDVRRLVIYLTRDVKISQGIANHNDAIRLLYDYVDMATKLGVSYDKYPKSLKKEHDIVMLNYKTMNNKLEKEKFVKIVTSDDYEKLKYNDKKYDLSIIAPTEPKDLIKEGEHLNHCVGSYVERIANNSTMVLFLRQTKAIEEPFVTIEVMNKRIRQVKSQSNRKPDQKVMSFVKDWAKEKELELAIY